ncbi:uncharacterized protein LOC128218269 [Mya arenaria]|uniref:uncharacterized protein LOC128218269 n=1 Tax=Mya arenaria TaxID=6604 RepID=UPI0022E31222|nr:uncharacterized protein LOC128218269 [Mya arenaria]
MKQDICIVNSVVMKATGVKAMALRGKASNNKDEWGNNDDGISNLGVGRSNNERLRSDNYDKDAIKALLPTREKTRMFVWKLAALLLVFVAAESCDITRTIRCSCHGYKYAECFVPGGYGNAIITGNRIQINNINDLG